MHGRFSRPTYPGETLTISMWLEGPTARFRTANQRGDTVLDHGVFRFL
jgi:acyl dehydratase